MSNYGWTNEEGEPIMSGEAYRFEQQLDADSRDDYYADHFYDDDGEEELCDECQSDTWDDTRDGAYLCDACCAAYDEGDANDDGGQDAPYVQEDQWLDSYMEDRISTMYEG